jgi:hypothetical protein
MLISFSVSTYSGKTQRISGDRQAQQSTIQVIDFHSTHRCETCLLIEKKAKSVLEDYFKQEMNSGLIHFKTVDVDKKENYALAEEFEATGTALFINVLTNGKSTKINLTDFAFLNARSDDDAFEKGFKSELEKAIKLL